MKISTKNAMTISIAAMSTILLPTNEMRNDSHNQRSYCRIYLPTHISARIHKNATLSSLKINNNNNSNQSIPKELY